MIKSPLADKNSRSLNVNEGALGIGACTQEYIMTSLLLQQNTSSCTLDVLYDLA